MNNKKIIISLSIALLLLVVIAAVLLVKLIKTKEENHPVAETAPYAADAEQTQADGETATGENVDNRSNEAESAAPAEPTTAPLPDEGAQEALSFASLPEHYMFLSGVGAWKTELWLKDDGSFHGEYFDSDMGVHQYYFCNFDGQFAAPVQLDEYSWSLKIETMETNHELNGGVDDPEAEFIESEPYGIANTQELILYLPGTSLTLLPEACISWMHLSENDTEIPADMYVLYNAAEGYAFVSEVN